MKINYIVNKTFSLVHTTKAKYIFVMGPVGSGKSSGCIMHLFLHALRQQPEPDTNIRRSKYLVVRSTYPALKSTTIRTWISWFKDKIKVTYDTPIRATINFPIGDGTSLDMEILFIAVDSEQSIEKLRSLEVTGAHINEATEVNFATLEMVASRINRYPKEIKDPKTLKRIYGPIDPFIICDYNAPDTDHWLYKLAEETYPNMPPEQKETFEFYKQPPAVFYVNGQYVENPDADNIDNLPAGYYNNQCMLNSEDFIRVNLMNNYGTVRSGRPVYKDFDDYTHTAKNNILPLRGVHLYIGIDQGLTPAAAFIQQDPSTGAILVLDEITTEDCSLQEFCNDILWPKINNEYAEWRNTMTLVVDPATVQRSMNDAKAGTDIIKAAGFKYKIAKSNIATLRREAVINFLLKKDKFKLSPKCAVLRKGFISDYHYEERRSMGETAYKDIPAKNACSHVHDALQYAVLEFYRKNSNASRFKPRKYQAVSTIGGY